MDGVHTAHNPPSDGDNMVVNTFDADGLQISGISYYVSISGP